MLDFLKNFKEHVSGMEVEFDQQLKNHDQLNNMLHAYETNLIDHYVNANRDREGDQANNAFNYQQDHPDESWVDLEPEKYMVFDALVKSEE